MSSKRKWDQAAPFAMDEDGPTPAKKTEDGKTASEAAAAAVAIAAKIAAQFAAGGGVVSSSLSIAGGGSFMLGQDLHDAEFTHDIDINDVRNRYMLTKGTTQMQVKCAFFFLPPYTLCQCVS
jgi:hypothetical protein